MELCTNDTVAEETSTAVVDENAAITDVIEKHESELQEKRICSSNSVSELRNKDFTELPEVSPKEDDELSSSRCMLQNEECTELSEMSPKGDELSNLSYALHNAECTELSEVSSKEDGELSSSRYMF